MKTANEWRSWVDKKKSEKQLLEKLLTDKRQELKKEKSVVEKLLKAQYVLTEVSQQTQKIFKSVVESLVTKAIRPVFNRDYKFILNYDKKGRKSWIQPLVKEGDTEPQVPKEDMGVSILDVISYIIRVVLRQLERPQSRPLLWLDEPLRDIGRGRELTQAANIMKEVSKRSGFQLIVNTHEPAIAVVADRVFNVERDDKWSKVTVEGEKPTKWKRIKT